MAATQSYLLCCVQRTGSWLLAHSLRDTHRAGYPSDYWDLAERQAHSADWGIDHTDSAAYLEAVTEHAATRNGVIGTKMMWNDFGRFQRELCELYPDARRGRGLLSTAFPKPRFIWLRRRDKIRQGVSWWRADKTNQWQLEGAEEALQPELDLTEILPLVRYTQECEDGWRRWFEAAGVSPVEVFYEELEVGRLSAVNRVLGHLDLQQLVADELPATRYQRQANELTERYVEAVTAALESP